VAKTKATPKATPKPSPTPVAKASPAPKANATARPKATPTLEPPDPTPEPSPTGGPDPPPTAAGAPVSAPQTYIVQSGDTLPAIADQVYGDANQWTAIYDANRATVGDDPDVIQVGIQLTIPPKES